jgi:hypothetical protein
MPRSAKPTRKPKPATLPASLVERHIRALERNTAALERHSASLNIESLQHCVLHHLNMDQVPPKEILDKTFDKLFNGIAKPIDTIITACGQDCYTLDPSQVWERVNKNGGEKKVNTLRAFLKCVST